MTCFQTGSLFTALVCAAMATALAQSPNGAVADDGDDIILAGTDYRLQGIDAFEETQDCTDKNRSVVQCGKIAKAELAAIIRGQVVDCRPTGKRSGRRTVARCFAGGVNVEEEMVRRGWAFVRPDFAKERTSALCQLERTSAASQRGAWALDFQRPYFVKGGRNKTLKQIACQHEHAR